MAQLRTLGFLALFTLAGMGTAEAHARLLSADPAPGSVLRRSPAVISLRFSEPLVTGLCGMTLVDSQGRAAPLDKPQPVRGDPHRLTAAAPRPLPAGAYTLRWTALSTDTHRTTGSFGFRIAP
jgi:methionine-rich copper-binding protein CopC